MPDPTDDPAARARVLSELCRVTSENDATSIEAHRIAAHGHTTAAQAHIAMATGAPLPTPDGEDDGQDDPRRIDLAWRIHAAILDWMGKIDAKASFTLALNGALLLGVTTLAKDDGPFHDLKGASAILFFIGCAFLLTSAVSALIVLFPGLDLKAMLAAAVLWIERSDWVKKRRWYNRGLRQYGWYQKILKCEGYLATAAEKNFIFFGNLQVCDDKKIRTLLAKKVEPALAVQLSRISKIAARKHLWAQIALMCVLVGVIVLTITYLTHLAA